MSSQDRLENVLRDIHVMISKSEAYDADRIIVSKQDIFALIDRLNVSIYEIMDEYELTQQSRDRALRENKKEGDKIIWDASRQAEDIYAASVLYTEEALNHLHVMVEEADHTIGRLYQEFQENMKQQQETIRDNQLELKSQLQLLADTEKYLKLIEDRNREIEREREEKKGRKFLDKEKHILIKPEIRINEEYFRKAGIPLETDEDEDTDEEDGMELLEDEGVVADSLKIKWEVRESDAGGETEKEPEQDLETESRTEEPADGETAEEELADEAAVKTAEEETVNKAAAEEEPADRETPEEESIDEKIDEKRSEKEIAKKEAAQIETKQKLIRGGAAEGEETSGNGSGRKLKEKKEKKEKKRKSKNSGQQETEPIPLPVMDKEAEEALKLNLDAEYFQWKSEEQGEPEKPQREKLSLLDKLIGKKKSY